MEIVWGIGILLLLVSACIAAGFVLCNIVFQPIILIVYVLKSKWSPEVHIAFLRPFFFTSLLVVSPLMLLILFLFAIGGY